MEIYPLHGFLGRPTDWEFFIEKNPKQQWHLIDLFDEKQFQPPLGFWSWAKTFNASVEKSTKKKVLLGYSLGGRLALHALLDQPNLWDAAVIVSANPGLENEADREPRCLHDAKWAGRFLSSQDSWNTLMRDWNSQGVFSKSSSFDRLEADFSRKMLADVLTGWSLGKQDDLKSDIQRITTPILWIAGEDDQKFSAIARSLAFFHPCSRTCIVSNAGHRVPWQEAEMFQQQMEIFLENVNNTAVARM